LIERTPIAIVPSLTRADPGTGRSRPRTIVAATLERKSAGFPALGKVCAEAAVALHAIAASSMPADECAEAIAITDAPGGEGTGNGNGQSVSCLDGPEARRPGTVTIERRGTFIRNFRCADLVAAMARGDVDVLHLATHAAFNGRSDRSYIVADGGELIPVGELRALIQTAQRRGDQLDLVVLSACQTAVGDDQASMGLAGVSVQAGARSAMASLWVVEDYGTAELMKSFYRAYASGAGKSAALRTAQLELLGRGEHMAQPFIWAAFVMLGGWR
jgi:hypothetical protein